jgi:hypothetical protein
MPPKRGSGAALGASAAAGPEKKKKSRATVKKTNETAHEQTIPATTSDGGPSGGAQLWLMKSEPDEYSIETLRDSPGGRGFWDGVRNGQAKNHMMQMKCVLVWPRPRTP